MDELKLQIKRDLTFAVKELCKVKNLHENQILVLGCSTSEVIGKKIGTFGSLEVAESIYQAIQEAIAGTGVTLAVQCCEHLNRAVVMEEEIALAKGFEIVNVVPELHAGGAMATYTYQQLKHPCIVEFIKADAGIDIGDTLIGMHLKHVAVPFRIEGLRKIGEASLVMAFTRPKYIGGIRATYQ